MDVGYNVTLRRLRETIIAVEKQSVLNISVCVCARAWVHACACVCVSGRVRACARVSLLTWHAKRMRYVVIFRHCFKKKKGGSFESKMCV